MSAAGNFDTCCTFSVSPLLSRLPTAFLEDFVSLWQLTSGIRKGLRSSSGTGGDQTPFSVQCCGSSKVEKETRQLALLFKIYKQFGLPCASRDMRELGNPCPSKEFRLIGASAKMLVARTKSLHTTPHTHYAFAN